MNKKYLIIYHKEDNDGVFSAAIFFEYLINNLHINSDLIDLLPADYNYLNKVSNEYDVKDLHKQYNTILMTDISFNNIDYMKALYEEFGYEFIWCDHHAPIINLTNKTKLIKIPGIRDTKCSAILCVWRYLYDPFNTETDKIPTLFKILSAWDSWTYKENNYDLNYVKNINIGINSEFKLDIYKIIPFVKTLKKLYINGITETDSYNDSVFIENIYTIGETINKYQDFINENLIANSGDCSWKIYTGEKLNDGSPIWRTACALFLQGSSNSIMFKSIVNNDNSDIMNGIVFKRLPNSNWNISLYNIRDYEPAYDMGGFHCGNFLKKFYNGGGHQGAAGCVITEDEFIKILKNKCLGYL